MATTGKELQLKRIAMDVDTKDVARAMGVLVSRISHIEGSRKVTDKAAARYLAALATFGTVPTVSVETPTESAA